MPSTYQCDSCGLGVCAGWFHYHDITKDGFGSSTLAYCAACGVQYRIDHGTTELPRKREPGARRRASEVPRALLGLGSAIGVTLILTPALLLIRNGQGDSGIALAKASPPAFILSVLLGFLFVEVANILAPQSVRLLLFRTRYRRRRIIRRGIAVGLVAGLAGVGASLINFSGGALPQRLNLWLGMAGAVLGALALIHALGRGGRRMPRPTLWNQITRGVRAARARRSKRTEPAAQPPDRTWRQAGPVDMPNDDRGSEPAFGDWLPFDPGSDIRPIRQTRYRGTLEGVEDALLLADVQCGNCQIKGAISHRGPSPHPCPRCRKGMLEICSAWMT